VRAKGESFLIDLVRCGDERATSVAVRAADASQPAVLWRIESTDRGSDRSRFVVGADYKGFETVVPFDGFARPDALAIVEVRTDDAQAPLTRAGFPPANVRRIGSCRRSGSTTRRAGSRSSRRAVTGRRPRRAEVWGSCGQVVGAYSVPWPVTGVGERSS
jgi:hypothetical protein